MIYGLPINLNNLPKHFSLGFRVLGFMVSGLGFRVYCSLGFGLWLRVKDLV